MNSMLLPRVKPPTDLSWRARLASLGNVWPLFSMLWAASPILFIGTVLLRVSRAALPAALLWVPKLILDKIVAIVQGHGSPDIVWRLLLLEMTLALLSDLLSQANSAVDTLLGDRFTNFVALRLMDHAVRLDLASFEDSVFYDKLERVRGQATGRMALLTSLLNAGQELVTLIILSAGLTVFSVWLTILLVVCTIPTFIGQARFSKLSYAVFFKRTPQRRELEYLRFLATCAESAKEVRVFGLGSHLSARLRTLADHIYIENRELACKRALGGWALGALAALGYYGGYVFILRNILAGAISIGTFTFLTGSFARSRSSTERIVTIFNDISEQALLLTDLFDFFKMVPSICNTPNAIPAPRPMRDGIEFRNVGFAYPGAKQLVVRNINLRISPSERIALVGENGAGKTTLAKLLCRLYDPVCGQILLDGIDLREYDLNDWRQQISVLFQDFMRYDLLVRDNIGFGDLTCLADDAKLRVAAEKGGAQALIDKFPLGFDQILGRRFQGGLDLSGGEWQKIGLARAYARDAQLFILDEPTASLDVRAEHEIFNRFADMVAGRMSVLISHRFTTVRKAQNIIVLEQGEIRQQGTHEHLMRLGGLYAELFELQAADFREGSAATAAHQTKAAS